METPDPLAARRAEFRFSHPIAVRFNDFDLLGHINNAVYLTFCEVARFAYLEAVTGDLRQSDLSLILAHMSIDYRRPIGWAEAVRIATRTVSVGTKSFTMEYVILGTAAEGEYIAAEARSVQVGYDYTAGRSVPLLPTLVAALEAFEGRSLRS
jgi:acyl-CoA thioester hydrolase